MTLARFLRQIGHAVRLSPPALLVGLVIFIPLAYAAVFPRMVNEMRWPINGYTFDGDTTNGDISLGPRCKGGFCGAFDYFGFVDQAGAPIEVQVLKDEYADPTVDSNWGVLARGKSATLAGFKRDGRSWYYWEVTSKSKGSSWPQGGVQRVRTRIDGLSQNLRTFSFPDTGKATACTNSTDCLSFESPYPFVTKLSTTPNPTDDVPEGIFWYLRWPSQSFATVDDIFYYYAKIGAPGNLGDFREKYGFGKGNTSEVSATYFNQYDLGLGREMHCVIYGVFAAVPGIACYVTNYDGYGEDVPIFDNPYWVLSDAINRTHAVATVAMVYNPATGGDPVQFMVFDKAGNLSPTAQLDSKGFNSAVPDNCQKCHGGSFELSTHRAQNGHFLPFDVFRLRYAGDAGMPPSQTTSDEDGYPGYTYEAQAEQFRKLNALIYRAGATVEIRERLATCMGGRLNYFFPERQRGNLSL
jgi:hypothetical protein